MTAGLERGYIFHLGTLQQSPCRVNQTLPSERKGHTVLSFSFISEGRKSMKKTKKKSFSAVQTEKRETKLRLFEHYICFYLEKTSFDSVSRLCRVKGTTQRVKSQGVIEKSAIFSEACP